MLNRDDKSFLCDETSKWLTNGWVSQQTHALLLARYGAREHSLAKILKAIGAVGGFLAVLGLMGFLSVLAGNLFMPFLFLSVISAALFAFGFQLARHVSNAYPFSSKIVLFLAYIAGAAAVGVGCTLAELQQTDTLLVTGLIVLPIAFILAYTQRNGFLLILGVLSFFHWIGSWESMVGRSTYVFAVQDPKMMAFIAAMVAGVGIWHEREYAETIPDFHRAYQVFGLLYLNMSLLILSIHGGRQDDALLFYVVLFTLMTMAQFVYGAVAKASVFTGFGVTFFAINLYTRIFENFWDVYHKGFDLVAGGSVLLLIAFALEKWRVSGALKGIPS